MEPGHPVTWFTRDEFLRWSCFAEFYTLMFQQVVSLDGDTEVVVHALDWDLDAPAHDRAVRDLETA